MNNTARAAVFTGEKQFKISNINIPDTRNDGILIKVNAAGICGSDLHIYKEIPPFPVILGHEVTGTIVDMGKNANSSMYCYYGPLKVGDRVALYPTVTCGKCMNCLDYGNGAYSVCEKPFGYGDWFSYCGDGDYTGRLPEEPALTGGFAEYMYIYPGTYLWKVPDEMDDNVAVLLDPLAVAMRSVELAQRCPGVLEDCFNINTVALVIGDGSIGTLTSLCAKLMGVKTVVVAGGREQRLNKCKEISGADYLLNYKTQSFEERKELINELTRGRGADVVFQCVGKGYAFREGLDLLKRLGTLVECGNAMKASPVQFDPFKDLCAKHATLVGMTVNTPQAFNKAFTLLMNNSLGLERIFTHKCSLETLSETMNMSNENSYMKGLLRF